jgi:hypothetical protein
MVPVMISFTLFRQSSSVRVEVEADEPELVMD